MKPCILIVDDVPENIAILAEALGDGYEVRFATGGLEALGLLRSGDPVDLVLLDIVMPGMDGYEVCRRLKAEPATRDIPVLFLTSRDEEESEARGLALGAVDYIKKPFSAAIVKARIRGILRLKVAVEERERLRAGLASGSSTVAGGGGVGARLGNYTLVERIASGGMGEVWRVEDVLLKRTAAAKLIGFGEGVDPAGMAVKRFQREAKALASLESPHTIRFFEYDVTPEGCFYYVMELLEGADLETLVRIAGPLPAARCVHLLQQACLSLGEAHARGLIHRDIKPANLFCCRHIGDEYDVLKVLDFGLVKDQTLPGSKDPGLTQPGRFLGTAHQASPESAAGEGGEVDARSDIYSLGCTAYYLLTGSNVFPSHNQLQLLMDHIGTEPESPSRRLGGSLPPELDALILSCLAKAKSDRPQDMDELARRLGTVPLDPPWGQAEARDWWGQHRAETLRPRGAPGEV
jgi:CheY-like chemotaxis protein